MNNLTSSEFVLDLHEIEEIFGYVTKMPREKWATVVKLDVDQLVSHVFAAIDANIVEDVRLGIRDKKLQLVDLLSKYDKDRDGMLSYHEVETMFFELNVVLSPQTQARFFKSVLDKRDAKRISLHLLQSCFGENSKLVMSDQLDLEPSRDTHPSQ